MCYNMYVLYVCVFFFKQKTAYEMRIIDWSSDVCSSDLKVVTIICGGDPDDSYPSAKSVPGQRWQAGLDAWAGGNYKAAAEAFTSMVRASGLSRDRKSVV